MKDFWRNEIVPTRVFERPELRYDSYGIIEGMIEGTMKGMVEGMIEGMIHTLLESNRMNWSTNLTEGTGYGSVLKSILTPCNFTR